ncbi:uncharacterized protein LOC117167413 [Belonocnema kinseyi]|uniref:uncharacterized protein LOC117167413 n=1 Tax=Belonocnema kinseyi TaxID=2817044 RepID=UPI00143DD46A|nr:uncharacterized protein LOC117167413 [Belonocnema kinseyi]
MDGVKISLTLIIFMSSAYGSFLPVLNNQLNSLKSEELSDSKVAQRIVSKISFSNLAKLSDPIDKEGTFWINPQREKKSHYESVKFGQSTKNPEDVSNFIDLINKNEPSVMNTQINYHLERHPTWFGFHKSFSKIGPKPAKTIERTFNSNPFDSESKTVPKLPLQDTKSGSNVNRQQGTTADKSSNTEKNTNTEKSFNAEKASDKLDLDVNDLLVFKELSDELDDFSEEKIKEELEKQPTTQLPAIQRRGFFNPPIKRKVVSPIFSKSFDILRLPFQQSGFSFYNQVQRTNANTNRIKYLEIKENEIKNNSKEHLIWTEKVQFLVFNHLKKRPHQHFYQLRKKNFKPERSVGVQNIHPFSNLPKPAFTMTKISVSPVQGHVEDLGSFLKSLKLYGKDNGPKMMKLNFRSVKPPPKEESLSAKPVSLSRQHNNLDEDSKQTHGPHSISMEGKMIFDTIHGRSVNKFATNKMESKEKKEVEKLSELGIKELCKNNLDGYPRLYNFFEKFSDAIM